MSPTRLSSRPNNPMGLTDDFGDEDPDHSRWAFYGVESILAVSLIVVVGLIASLVFGGEVTLDEQSSAATRTESAQVDNSPQS